MERVAAKCPALEQASQLLENHTERKAAGPPKQASYQLREQALQYVESGAIAPAQVEPVEMLEAVAELHFRQIDLEMQNQELRRELADLEISRARYFNFYERAPVGYVTLNADGLLLEMNLRAAELLAAPRGTLQGRPFREFIFRDDGDIFYLSQRRLFKASGHQVCELRLGRANNAVRWVRLEMSLGDGDAPGIFQIVLIDVHDHKTAEEHLEAALADGITAYRQLQAKDEQLQRSLGQKEVLLREIHHRVKNNLQVVSSLLRMHAERLEDGYARAALQASHDRILSMATVQERIFVDEGIEEVDFEECAETLVQALLRSHASSAGHVTSRLNLSRVMLSIDQAVPCSLILNELVSNALKFAYPNGESGEVVVHLRELDGGMVALGVADQGAGLPEDLDWRYADSLGLPIVDMLANQIGGSLTLLPGPGTAFEVRFFRRP